MRVYLLLGLALVLSPFAAFVASAVAPRPDMAAPTDASRRLGVVPETAADPQRIDRAPPARNLKLRGLPEVRSIDDQLHRMSSDELATFLPGKRVISGRLPHVMTEHFDRTGRYTLYVNGGVVPFNSSGVYIIKSHAEYCVRFRPAHSTMDFCARIYRDKSGKYYMPIKNVPGKVWSVIVIDS